MELFWPSLVPDELAEEVVRDGVFEPERLVVTHGSGGLREMEH